MKLLQGKIAVVTGGGSGIGRAISEKFAHHGASVHIVDVSPDSALSVVQQIQENQGEAFFHQCDLSNYAQVKTVFATLSTVDILVNNAGIAHVGNIERTSEEDLDRLLNINVKGVYHGIREVISGMVSRKSGVILNMASIAATCGIPDRFAYSTTKGAIYAMTLSIARDYVQYGIRCNSISPARVHTPFVDGFLAKNYPGKEKEMYDKLSKAQPIGRMGTPEEVASLTLFLCSDDARFITGCDYPLDGGFLKLLG